MTTPLTLLPGIHPNQKDALMEIALAVFPSLVFGFAAGLLSFRIKSSWCAECGETKRCVSCTDRRRADSRHQPNIGKW